MSQTTENDEHDAFEATALPYMEQLYSTAFYLSRDRDRAADLVQDTLLRAFRFWHQFRPGTNCKAWLITILYNTFRNNYRAQKAASANVEFEEEAIHSRRAAMSARSETDPAELLASEALDDQVAAALQKLSPDFLEVVLLVDIQELSYEEAAEVIGRPVGTVRSRLSRARRQLQELLLDYAHENGLME